MLNYVSLGKYSIIKYNFVDNTYETIGTIEEYEELDYYSKPQFLDSEGKLYFTATVNRNMKGTFSVDILSGEITRIWMGNFDFIFYDQYNVTDDLLILADHWGKVMAISKASGEMVWKYEDKYLGSIRKIIRKGESLYISAKDKIASLDLMSGELNWDLSGPNFLDYVETYEQEELLISINYDLDDNGLVIFDLNNGQKLINLRLPQPDSQYARLFTHIEDKGEVIIVSKYDLFKYSEILP